jgi:hypothetical protein
VPSQNTSQNNSIGPKQKPSDSKLYFYLKLILPLALPTIAYLPTLLFLMLYSTKEIAYANDPLLYQNITNDTVAFTCLTPNDYNAWGYILGASGFIGNAAFSGLMIYDLLSETEASCPRWCNLFGFILLLIVNLTSGMLNGYNARDAGQYFSQTCQSNVPANSWTVFSMLIAMLTPAIANTRACIALVITQYHELKAYCRSQITHKQRKTLYQHYGIELTETLLAEHRSNTNISLSQKLKNKMTTTLLSLIPALAFSIYACLYYINYTNKFTSACCTDWNYQYNPACTLQSSILPGILSFITNTVVNTLLYKETLIYPMQRCGSNNKFNCNKKMLAVYSIVMIPSISIAFANIYLAYQNKQLSKTNQIITTVATPINLFVFCMAGLGEILLERCPLFKEDKKDRNKHFSYEQIR